MMHLANQQFRAGYGVATVLPDMDFETYSEAGYVWDEAAGKWAGLPGAPKNKRGLPVVGASTYSEHPSCEVLSFQYDLKDGHGARFWRPGMPNPEPLFAHMAAGGLTEAWNVGFERWVWVNVCMPKYGWPAPGELRCAMAKARAFGLPGALGDAGAVMQLDQQKDGEGKRLLDKFSKPRNPTKKDLRRRVRPEDDPDDAARLYAYNAQDIVAEAAASIRVPDLTGEELEFWKADQAINARGVAVDLASVHACIALIGQAHERYNVELAELTGGAVTQASQVEKLIGWLAGAHRVYTNSLDEESVDELLRNRAKYAPAAVRALEIRQAIGSAGVKKVFAMANRAARDGRLHDLFNYYAARTGRATGEAVQPTNMAREGPPVYKCGACGHYHQVDLPACPWCAMPCPPAQHCPTCNGRHGMHARTCADRFAPLPGRVADDWSIGAAEDALAVIATRSLEAVEYYFGEAMAALSGCLRALFVAAPGHDLISSDYSSIEAVVLAQIAGEEWRLEVFRTHGKIYELSVSKIAGLPFEEIMAYKKRTGKHHPLRQTVGKVAELACFSPDTQVLTDRGYVRIVDVLPKDKLWDGVEWVTHRGVVPKGRREILDLDGVGVTPRHPIFWNGSWREARLLASDASMLSQALANGSENLPSWVWTGTAPACSARADGRRTWSVSATSAWARAPVAPAVAASARAIRSNGTGPTPTLSRTTSTVGDCSTVSPLAFSAVTTPKTPATKTTEAAASMFGNLGVRTAALFSRTWLRCRVGTSRLWSWTANRWTAVTPPETCGLSAGKKTCSTNEASPPCRPASQSWSDVYDIAHAGPRNRFTIRTNTGHLLVHNSGYQGWIGAWLAFDAGDFMTEDQIKEAILKWRAASPAIVELWGGQERRRPQWRREYFGVEGAAIQAILNPGVQYQVKRLDGTLSGVTFVRDTTPAFGLHDPAWAPLYCYLPSGRPLTYHCPQVAESERGLSISYEGWNTNPKNGPKGWIEMRTWGGRLVENIVQATARDILRHAIVNLERFGYPVVLHVYDEIVCEVPEGLGDLAQFERIMATMPAWAAGWPIKADGGWRGKRYRKG